MSKPDIEQKKKKKYNPNFELMMKYMEINASQKALVNYLTNQFSFLSNKDNTTDFLSFYHWTQFPLPIAERFYAVFIKSTKKVSIEQNSFIGEITSFYLSNIETQIKILFNLFDWNNDLVILIEDVKLLFVHLMTYSNQSYHNKGLQIINDFFEENKAMTFQTFYIKTINKNSNCFYLFIFILFLYKPFTNKSLMFFSSIIFKEEKSIVTNTFKYYEIKEPSEELYDFFNETFEIPFDINSDLDVLEQFEESLNECRCLLNPIFQSISKKLLRQTLSTNSKSTLTNTFIISENEKENNFAKDNNKYCFSTKFTIHDGNQIKEYRLFIVDKDIYILKKAKTFDYSFKQLIPIKEIFCEQGIDIEKKTNSTTQAIYYPFHIISTVSQYYRDSLIYFDNLSQLKNVQEAIESKTHYRNFDDYYEMLSNIDHGAYGKIFTARHIETNKIYAVKAMKKINEDYKVSDNLEYYRAEQYISRFLKANPFKGIVAIYDIFETKDTIYIIQEYINKGNLFRYIKNPKSTFSHELIPILLSQVIESVTYLKTNGIVHRDLKLENVLIDHDPKDNHFQAKLIDFGLSCIILKEEKLKGINGTFSYLPPEMLLKDACYSFNIDVWNIGLMGYIMLYGFNPFKDETIEDMIKKREHSIVSFPKLECTSNNGLLNIIKSCLETNHLRRPQIEMIHHQCMSIN